LGDQFNEDEMGGAYSTYNVVRYSFKLLSVKSDGKKPLVKRKCGLKENIEADVKTMLFEVLQWIHVSQNRVHWWTLVDTVINIWVP
jgi:hypothetical protein